MRTVKMPGKQDFLQRFFYLCDGYQTESIEGIIKTEDEVRYAAIKKIMATKPNKEVELTDQEFDEVSGFLSDTIEVRREQVEEGLYTQKKLDILEKYYFNEF